MKGSFLEVITKGKIFSDMIVIWTRIPKTLIYTKFRKTEDGVKEQIMIRKRA